MLISFMYIINYMLVGIIAAYSKCILANVISCSCVKAHGRMCSFSFCK